MNDTQTMSTRFWLGVLVFSMLMTPVVTAAAHTQGGFGTNLSDRVMQSLLYVAVCCGLAALLACRVLIGRAMEEDRRVQVYALSGMALAASAALITYGISSFV